MSHDALRQTGAGDGYLPPQDELTAPWWDGTRERRLLLQRCGTCGEVQHHPRHLCLSCGATEGLGWVESAGGGTVDTFTVVHRAPRAGLEAPYVVARVRLDDGPVLLAWLLGTGTGTGSGADLPDPRIGDVVALDWAPLEDGRALPVFRLVVETP